jgi:ABC-type lipoprotein release transport system permease subunit
MKINPFFYFLALSFFKDRKKHFGVILLSILLLFLLCSTLFISSSIRYSLEQTLTAQPDFVVQRIRGGERVDAPLEWIDALIQIPGVESVSPRVYGYYSFQPKGSAALVVGVDFLDEQSHLGLRKIIGDTDLRQFLQGENMVVGEGVSEYLKSHFYPDGYNFFTPQGEFYKLHTYGVLPKASALLSNDMILVTLESARKILGVGEESASDITFNVPNGDEWANISDKISALYYDVRVVTKKDVAQSYEKLYNYKGGIFLILFVVALATFALMLYQRYSTVYSNEKRAVGVLRALGWSIQDILRFKFYEAGMMILIAFILAIALAYGYVFVLGAPILREIFLGDAKINSDILLVPVLDFRLLGSLFLIYALPFVAAVLIPVWRIATIDPKEAMR